MVVRDSPMTIGSGGLENLSFENTGEMAEWSIAAVLKTVDRASGPGVRIPLSPQIPVR